jgi:hypothetical protein
MTNSNYVKYLRIVNWAQARYTPARGDTSFNTRRYNAIVVAAMHKYHS